MPGQRDQGRLIAVGVDFPIATHQTDMRFHFGPSLSFFFSSLICSVYFVSAALASSSLVANSLKTATAMSAISLPLSIAGLIFWIGPKSLSRRVATKLSERPDSLA